MSSEAAVIPQSIGIPASLKPASVAECHVVIEMLAVQNAQLREQVALIEERLKLDSRNSSKPPSHPMRPV